MLKPWFFLFTQISDSELLFNHKYTLDSVPFSKKKKTPKTKEKEQFSFFIYIQYVQ